VSTAPISSTSLLDESLTVALTQSTNQATGQGTNAFISAIARKSTPDENTSNTPDILTQDLINLLKTLATGNISGARNDINKLQTDLQAQTTANASSTPATSPLNTLVTNISNALNSGSVQGALQDLANYLVQNGQASGGLINTST